MKKTLTSLLIVALILLIMAMPALWAVARCVATTPWGPQIRCRCKIHPRFNRSLL